MIRISILQHSKQFWIESVHYGIVGLTLNGVGYAAYLLLTSAGFDPALTVSILYPTSLVLGFFAHRRHTFCISSHIWNPIVMLKYGLVYLAGYLINIALLEIGVRRFGLAHQFVQLLSIFLVAVFLFLTLRIYVFRKDS